MGDDQDENLNCQKCGKPLNWGKPEYLCQCPADEGEDTLASERDEHRTGGVRYVYHHTPYGIEIEEEPEMVDPRTLETNDEWDDE